MTCYGRRSKDLQGQNVTAWSRILGYSGSEHDPRVSEGNFVHGFNMQQSSVIRAGHRKKSFCLFFSLLLVYITGKERQQSFALPRRWSALLKRKRTKMPWLASSLSWNKGQMWAEWYQTVQPNSCFPSILWHELKGSLGQPTSVS